MPNRSWFFASEGQQRGPYPEAQFHEFIAKGTVIAETLVWTEGMTGWQKAGDIPGPALRYLRRRSASGRGFDAPRPWRRAFDRTRIVVLTGTGGDEFLPLDGVPHYVYRSGPTSPSPARLATSGMSSLPSALLPTPNGAAFRILNRSSFRFQRFCPG